MRVASCSRVRALLSVQEKMASRSKKEYALSLSLLPLACYVSSLICPLFLLMLFDTVTERKALPICSYPHILTFEVCRSSLFPVIRNGCENSLALQDRSEEYKLDGRERRCTGKEKTIRCNWPCVHHDGLVHYSCVTTICSQMVPCVLDWLSRMQAVRSPPRRFNHR